MMLLSALGTSGSSKFIIMNILDINSLLFYVSIAESSKMRTEQNRTYNFGRKLCIFLAYIHANNSIFINGHNR